MLLWFLLGLVLLVVGAEFLVRGASRLAGAAGVSPLVVGLTVVAFGTSAPELAVSVGSAWSGKADVAVGNVVGSNIFNVLLILGLSATITPLVVAGQLVRREVPLLVLLSLVTFAIALDGTIGRVDGVALLIGLGVYTMWSVRASRRETRALAAGGGALDGGAPGLGATPIRPRDATGAGDAVGSGDAVGGRTGRALLDLAAIVGGLVLLVLGAQWLVAATVDFARQLGVSEVVVGLTIVAAGTSLPEVATSVLAAIRGQRDIAVGNVVGSNIFNLMGVLGASGVTAPAGIAVPEAVLAFDLPVMVATAVACLPIFATGHRIDRFEGVLFLGYYGAYTAWLVLAATRHDALAGYSWVMATFVLPLTAVTLAILAARSWRRHRRAPRL